MNQYPSYKDSGVEWIGEIPSHWHKLPIKWFGDVMLGKMLTPNQKPGYVIKPYLRSQNIQTSGVDVSDVREMWFSKNELIRLLLKDSDLLLNEGGDVGRTSIWKCELDECYFQNSVNRIRFRDDSQMYFFYLSTLYHSIGYYDSIVNRVSIPHLTKDKLESVVFLRPPLPEQQQIVSFLDNKTALIDKLIATKKRKIELLKEYRTSLINQVVTKGLNPNVEMKDSGVEWIGEIPSHWGVIRLKNVSDVKPSNVDKHIFPDEIQVRLCNYTDVYYNDFITENTKLKLGSCSPVEFAKFKLEMDDVIITKDSESPDDIGVPCLVKNDFTDVVCGYHLTLIRPYRIIGGYIFRFIQSDRTRSYFEVHSNGITRYGLGKSTIENLSLPFPPLPEQHQIVSYLDEKTSTIDKEIGMEERKIELLKEYRQSLISEVVTGKKKVTSDE